MTEQVNTGGPAFPHTGTGVVAKWAGMEQRGPKQFPGMTLRDWVAGKCLASAFGDGGNQAQDVAPGETEDEALRRHWGSVAAAAFVAADAFIAAREGGVK